MKPKHKTLLIFFGELRTLEYVIPHLKKLDEVDIVISTWSESKRFDSKFEVDESLLLKILPNLKQYHIIKPTQISDIDLKWNTWKMIWHWKNAINNIKNLEEYDNVIVHRTDFISNWETILDLEVENDTIYFHHGDESYDSKNPNAFWINDYYFFGKFDIVKRFINLLDDTNYPAPHLPLWDVVTKNKLSIKKFILNGFLVRDSDIENVNKQTLDKNIRLLRLTGPK